MMPYVSGQIKFEDGDLGYKVKVTVTKKLKNTKKIRQKFKYAYLPLHIKCEGVLWSLLSVCLSVCLCVCHFVCKHNNSRTNHPILMKFGQIVYNHNRKVKFEDGLCPLIFKATAVKKPLEMRKISHYKSDFQHIDVKLAQ